VGTRLRRARFCVAAQQASASSVGRHTALGALLTGEALLLLVREAKGVVTLGTRA
jgi:hypothetical protein